MGKTSSNIPTYLGNGLIAGVSYLNQSVETACLFAIIIVMIVVCAHAARNTPAGSIYCAARGGDIVA